MRCIVLLALAGTAASALAQNSRLSFEATHDCLNGPWSNRLDARPGNTVFVQIRLAAANWGTHTALGLAGLTFQPTLTNWRDGDLRLPFSDRNNPPPPNGFLGVVPPFTYDRVFPPPPGGALTSHVDPGGILRFAGALAINPTTNLGWGVFVGQQSPLQAGTIFRDGTDVVIFRYAVTLSAADTSPRSMIASAPVEYIPGQRVNWYRQPNGIGNLLTTIGDPTENILPATIHVVPSPPAALVFSAGLLLTTRPRRRATPLPLPEGGGGGVGSRLQNSSPFPTPTRPESRP